MREKSVSLLTSMFKHKNHPRDNTFFRKMSQERNVSNVLPDVREVPLEDLMDSFRKILEEDGKPHEVIVGNEKNVCGEEKEVIEDVAVMCDRGGFFPGYPCDLRLDVFKVGQGLS